jgi:3-deoxy-D-manno-octulosonic acid kinase
VHDLPANDKHHAPQPDAPEPHVPGVAVEIAQSNTRRGSILFDRRRIGQADASLFDPQRYQQRQSEDARGGRGAVWFLRDSFGDAVLRHYRRGGLLGRLNRDRYLWTGESRTRAFREFRLLAELRGRGLPVPAPIAARYERAGMWYRADILVGLVPDACTLAQRVASQQTTLSLWSLLGVTLARFHREGVFHADLNAHNVLFDAADRIWLIDFDRGALRPPAMSWQRANLLRLHRSLRKVGAASLPNWSQAWQQVEETYASGIGRAGQGAA